MTGREERIKLFLTVGVKCSIVALATHDQGAMIACLDATKDSRTVVVLFPKGTEDDARQKGHDGNDICEFVQLSTHDFFVFKVNHIAVYVTAIELRFTIGDPNSAAISEYDMQREFVVPFGFIDRLVLHFVEMIQDFIHSETSSWNLPCSA